MTLIDSNAVIAFLRSGDAKLQRLFQSMPACVCGVIRAEILQGVKNSADRANAVAVLNTFQLLPIPDPVWDEVGDLAAKLRAAGVSVPFNDVVIAAVAIASKAELWTRDTQFQHIQRVDPRLALYQEPP